MKKEKRIAECRLHWTAFIVKGFFIALFVMIGLVELIYFAGNVGFALFFFAVAAIIFGYAYITYKTTYIAMTESTIIGHTGFIKSKIMSTPLSKVQSIGLSNGLLGKIFGYHTVTVSHAGTDRIDFVFERMAKGEEFSAKVNEYIK